ncbi:WW domain binding protein 4, partial [Entomortierella lignicola]
AEYWKSNAKFWCRFCKIYITDNKSTRNIHDAGTKHKENVERFLREQNQRGRDKEAETNKMNKQMEAIEKAAMKQYQLDVEAGLVQPSGSSPTPTKGAIAPSPVQKPPPPVLLASSSSDTKKAATGSNSEPVAKPAAKAETKPTIPVASRDETVGQPGEWQTVEAPAPRPVSKSEQGENGQKKEKDEGGNHYIPGADDDEDEADPEDLRGFKIVEKTYPVEADIPGGDGETESTGAAVFKKRKGGASKPRNIRRKL